MIRTEPEVAGDAVPATQRLPAGTVLLVVLVGLSAVAWLLTHQLSTPDTRLGLLTGAQDHNVHHHHGGYQAPEVVTGSVFMAMWVVMLFAMMLPTVLPVVSIFDRWVERQSRPRSLTLVFVGGYLAVWSVCGIAAYAALLMLQAWLPSDHDAVIRVGAVLLAAAGLYQFSSLKRSCLQQCRSPLAVIAEHLTELERGARGAFRVGVGHGLYCAGCCWSLMLVLVLLGMMSVTWMGLLAAVMFAEKTAPWGAVLSRAVGAVLVVLGTVLLAWPAPLPALS